ncbi:MAG: hypothetical protein ACYDA6_04020 [Solirubrobacteraceae bacterium]
MADPDEQEQPAATGADPRDTEPPAEGAGQCLPCHGSGRVISNLGATRTELECPWCGGSGVRTAGTDAQAHWSGPVDA